MEIGDLPPGFRFHPSDEELIVHYLFNKVKLRSLPASVIGEINLYNFDPWDLPNKALFGVDEWFFFTPRDKKYPNGSRPNRSAGSGFWKATGKDKSIYTSSGSTRIGLKKALTFYIGYPAKSIKTSWIMSEYRLPVSSSRSSGSMRLDDWVLCRVREKGNKFTKNIAQVQEYSENKLMYGHIPTIPQELPSPYMITNQNTDTAVNRRFKEIQLMASILAGQGIPQMTTMGSPKLLQGDNTMEYENMAVYKENLTLDEACKKWDI